MTTYSYLMTTRHVPQNQAKNEYVHSGPYYYTRYLWSAFEFRVVKKVLPTVSKSLSMLLSISSISDNCHDMIIHIFLLEKVRWADIEERKNQERAREIGFVIGGTNWNQITDDDYAERALNRTKYI